MVHNQELSNSTYAISEYGHWEEPHAYLFIGNTMAALVDTGLGIGRLGNVVQRLTNKPVLAVTTHCHWDHIEGYSEFADIAIHYNDRGWLENGLPVPISLIRDELMKMPFTRAAPNSFNPGLYEVYTGKPFPYSTNK